ncbi:MAG: iron-containing alcohol dehydrogenase, partial [Synergistales bacterium]|nr:iron-containing alcohol dehydrogenase [Synergistales bacterium]MDY6429429.1 iron-containing alcohol dehydrogenase [Synergistales bacterium]
MWDEYFDFNTVSEIRLKTTTYFGAGAIAKISGIVKSLKARGINQVLCMTGGRSYKLTGAWDYVEKACKENGVGITLYNKVTPNPTTVSIDEAVALAKKDGAKAVISIGGGSPIDAGKSAAVLLAYPDKTAEELYTFKFTPDHAAPIIAINLTHGTGTEVDRFAVATIPHLNFKPAIAYDCIYPEYSIDDPALMTKLSLDQTRYVSIDAVNHVVEAATSVVANPLAISFGVETIRLVAKYLPEALKNPEDIKARYALLYAS